jgi:hypothetical protein
MRLKFLIPNRYHYSIADSRRYPVENFLYARLQVICQFAGESMLAIRGNTTPAIFGNTAPPLWDVQMKLATDFNQLSVKTLIGRHYE